MQCIRCLYHLTVVIYLNDFIQILFFWKIRRASRINFVSSKALISLNPQLVRSYILSIEACRTTFHIFSASDINRVQNSGRAKLFMPGTLYDNTDIIIIFITVPGNLIASKNGLNYLRKKNNSRGSEQNVNHWKKNIWLLGKKCKY